jgi:thiamine biosynthesis protein ThiS
MQVTVNGETLDLEAGLPLLSLLKQLGKPAAHVAVEHNGEILDRDGIATAVLREQDRLEIVHFVGGG